MKRLEKLIEAGQSYWLDNPSRQMLDSGEHERRVRHESLRGETSNPSTFKKAISAVAPEKLSKLATYETKGQ